MPQQGASFDNRIGRVGQLFQADSQTFVYNAAAPAGHAPLMAALRRIDRIAQLEQLAETVDLARGGGRAKPLVVVLDGVAEDELLGFVQRMGEGDFEREMLLPCDYLGRFDWPERSFHRMIAQLSSAIVRERAAPVPARAVAQDMLVDLIAGHDRSLAFAQSLDPDGCRRRPELLRAWADLIAGACRNPGNGLLICFLCVELCEPRREACDWLMDELRALAAEHDWCVLETLSALAPRHLTDWIGDYNAAPALAVLDYIRPDIAQAIFGDRTSLRYRHAIEGMLDVLAPYLQPQSPRWAA